jgi:hypothetical protein
MPIRIGALTYNIEKATQSPQLPYSKVMDLSPDIYVEMTQEDNRDSTNNEPIIDTLYIDSGEYKLVYTISLNKAKKAQNLKLKVFAKNSIANKIVVSSGKKAVSPKDKHGSLILASQLLAKRLGTAYGYTKGMVYVKVTFTDSSENPILFVNMHLPMDGSLNNLGLDYRKSVFTDLLNSLIRSGEIQPDTRLFVGGDLNFRMNRNGVNQLNTILANKSELPNYYLRELPFPDGVKKLTCKFTTNNANCRTRKMPKNGNLKAFLNNVQKTCGNSRRIPSRCDRFLISNEQATNVNVLLQEAVFLIPESDHNGLAACFDMY